MTFQHHAAQGAPDRAEATLVRIAATLERTEHLLAAVLDTLVAMRPEQMPTKPGAHYAAAFPPVMAALPPAPDLDTALTMGMEAPAPLVPPERKGPPSLYPRSDLTPGVTFPNITAEDVSVQGYAKRVRDVPEAVKRAVYLRYGLDPAKHEAAEVDHYVSLCLAGTNDIENLWPEPAVTPDAPGQIGFREKDAVEFWLHQQVCSGSWSLQAAQDAIRGDWYAVWLAMPHAHKAMLMRLSADAPEQP